MGRNKEFDKHLIRILEDVTSMLQFDYTLIECDCFVSNIEKSSLKMNCMIIDAIRLKNKSS